MGAFEPEPLPLFSYETARGLEGAFTQKPTRLPLEVPLQPVIVQPPPRNDVPIIVIGAITIIGLVGLFLAYFSTRRS